MAADQDLEELFNLIRPDGEGGNPTIYRIALKQGLDVENATLEWDAPNFAGFIPLKFYRLTEDGEKVRAVRYIAISNIDELVIDAGELSKCSPSLFIPEPTVRVRKEG